MTPEERAAGLFKVPEIEIDVLGQAGFDDLKRKIAAAIRADREECAKALDTIAASSPPGSEPLGFHAGVRHACTGGAAAIRGRK